MRRKTLRQVVMNEISPISGPRHSLPGNVKILGLASLLNDIASEMIFPLLPTFLLTVLGGNRFYLGAIEGAADSTSSILKLWSGAWSDRVGRRKGLVVVGYVLAALSRPFIGLIVAPWQLLTIRLADRFGKGIRASPRDALIADSTAPDMRGWAFGFHQAMDHVGAAIGPLLATVFLWLWPDELRPLFLVTLLPGLAVLGVLVLGLRETPRTAPPEERLHLTLQPFDRNFRLYLVALVIFTLGNSTDAFLLVRAGELGVPTMLLPALWCAFHVVKSSSNLLCGRAVDQFGPRPFIFMGWFVYMCIYLAFALATTAWEAWVFFLCYALFYGLTEPAEKTLVGILAGAERKGLAYGWYNCAIGVATLPASLIFGALYEMYGALAAFSWGASLALLAVALLATVRSPADAANPG
jgi:MFS family permease